MFKRGLLFFIFINNIAFAGNENYQLGARSASLSNTSVTLTDLWSAQNNQAGLSNINTITAGIYYDNRFLVNEMAMKAFAVAIPLHDKGTIAFITTYYGSKFYNEKKFGLAYSKQLSKTISAGIQLDYLNTFIADVYGSKGNVTAEAGIQAQITKSIKMGAHIFNPTRAKLANYNDERIPTIMKLGASYTFSDKILMCVETEKDVALKSIFKIGLEYHPIKQIYIRGGLSNSNVVGSFGFGFEFDNIKFDIASSYHLILGYTPQLSLIYSFK
jgi:uncharacterized protein YneR